MKNYTPLLKERWDKGWPAFHKYFIGIGTNQVNQKGYKIDLKEKYGGGRWNTNIEESVYFKYTPVPEEVACMALKMLSKEKDDFKEIGDYSITRIYVVNYQGNHNEIRVSIGGKLVILIGWGNGENVQNVYDEDEEGRLRSIDVIHGKHNIFKISGYYEARNFGFSWHKG